MEQLNLDLTPTIDAEAGKPELGVAINITPEPQTTLEIDLKVGDMSVEITHKF